MAKALEIPTVKPREGKKVFLPDIDNNKDGMATPLCSPLGSPLGSPCSASKLQAAISRGSSLASAGSIYSTRSSICSNCRSVCRVCCRAMDGKREVGPRKVAAETLVVNRAAPSKGPNHSCKRCGYVESPLVRAIKKEPVVR